MADIKVFSFPENGNNNIPYSIPIGGATSLEQWWDTVSHEVDHLQDAVMQYYDVTPGTEDAAWLQGYIMRLIVKALRDDGVMFL